MPLDATKKQAILDQLAHVAAGEKVRPIDIGVLTQEQFSAINERRSQQGLPSLESAVIVYVGRHHYRSRSADGYNIHDMVLQLESGLSADSVVVMGGRAMTALQNKVGRPDGYGQVVHDQVVLELTTRKPKAEAFSVIPKGDRNGPAKNKKPLT